MILWSIGIPSRLAQTEMIERQNNIIIALSTQHKTATLILQRALERRLPTGVVRLVDEIAQIKDFPISAQIVCVAPTIDRSGALLDELIERNSWLMDRKVGIIALCAERNAQIADRLFRAGALDCWPSDPESLSSLADWIIRYVRRNTLRPKETKIPDCKGVDLAEDIRRKTFHATVATVTHQINNPLSAILAISERSLSGPANAAGAAGAAGATGAESAAMSQIHECADRILEVTCQLQELTQPDSIETAAGPMIDISDSQSEESKIAALARRRFAYSKLPEKLTSV